MISNFFAQLTTGLLLHEMQLAIPGFFYLPAFIHRKADGYISRYLRLLLNNKILAHPLRRVYILNGEITAMIEINFIAVDRCPRAT